MASKFAEIYVLLGLKKEGFDKEVKSTKSSMMDMGKSFLKTTAMVAGTGVAIVAAGKQIYALGKRGAIVTQTADSFDFLSKKLGLAPDLLEQLRKASRGTIDDMTLMSSTATLLAGTTDEVGKAMGDATPQLLEIAKAANKLNPSLGTTAHMYESLSLGIKRQSPLILDNLGLTIKIGESNAAWAEKLGKTVDQLTAEEKQMALLNATLEAGNLLIAQVGGNVDSATDSYARLETSWSNLKDTGTVLLAEVLEPTISALDESVNASDGYWNAANRLKNLLDSKIITGEEYNELLFRMKKGYIEADEVGRILAEGEEELTKQIDIQTGAVVELTGAARTYHGALVVLTGAQRDATTSTDELAAANAVLKQQMSDLKLFISGPLGKEYDSYRERQAALTATMEETRLKIEELEAMDHLTEEQKLQIQEAQIEYTGLKMKYDEFINAHGEGSKKYAEEEAGIRDAMDETLAKIGELQAIEHLTPEQEQELADLRLTYEDLSAQYQANADEHDKATKRIMFNLLEQQAAVEGTTAAEYEFLKELAEHWGMVDQATADYVDNSKLYLQTLEAKSAENLGHFRSQLALTLGITESSVSGMRGQFGMLDGSMKNSIGVARQLEGAIAAIKSKTVTITTIHKTVYKKVYSSTGQPRWMGQHGLDAIVPPGFPNDSFPVMVTSGERVIVMTAQQQRKAGLPKSSGLEFISATTSGGFTSSTTSGVGSIFGGPNPVSGRLPNWVDDIVQPIDDMSDKFTSSTTSFADDVTDITSDFANDISWTNQKFSDDATATGKQFADDVTATSDQFVGDTTDTIGKFSNDILWTSAGFTDSVSSNLTDFSNDILWTSAGLATSASSAAAAVATSASHMVTTTNWFAGQAADHMSRIANAFANMPCGVPPATSFVPPPVGQPEPPPPPPPTFMPPPATGGTLPPTFMPPPATGGGGTFIGDPATSGQPFTGSTTGTGGGTIWNPANWMEQNVLVINTNAPVDLSTTGLEMLQAWARG